MPIEDLVSRLSSEVSQQLSPVTLDLNREARCGFPEAVFGEGKSLAVIREIVQTLLEAEQAVLVTRIDEEQAEGLQETFPRGRYNELARTFRIAVESGPESGAVVTGRVAVITAGTTDRHVAEESCETLQWMGIETTLIQDVGVAGPHRLPERLGEIHGADAVIVVAGLEGALPSVVGGYVDCPVIGVPSSVGYGASFGGVTALLAMLNSCSANVTVVNIDAGFKAGYVAGLIASRKHRAAHS
ncbi:MAG: 1-(5-phosphoribosyl)-5-amino-4-imidazole-carboxylate carboxylase [Planctomycetaceae bacterium]|nr:1-(5-phosphoribosyl)-5-amino-4-imidazole-carboxylate carboxylase [Planctomycetaceae bacterium]